MAISVRVEGDSLTFYLQGTAIVPWTSGTGTPWDTITTTPCQIANNPNTGQAWTPPVPAANRGYAPAVMGGGNLSVAEKSYELRTFEIPVQIRASTLALRLSILQTLRTLLTVGYRVDNPQLIIDTTPGSTGGTAYYEIIDGDVQEQPTSTFGSEYDSTLLRCNATLIVRQFATIRDGQDGKSLSTLINAQPYSGLSALFSRTLNMTVGELRHEGQPANILVVPLSSAVAGRIYMASLLGFERDDIGFSSTGCPINTWTSVGVATFTGTELAKLLNQYPVKARLFVRATIATNGAMFKADVSLGGTSPVIYTADVSSTVLGTSAVSRMVDFGDIPIPVVPGDSMSGNPDLRIQVYGMGSGGTATVSIIEVVVLLYYEFCCIRGLSLSSSNYLNVISFPNASGSSRLPLPLDNPIAVQRTSGGLTQFRAPMDGDAPLARPNTLLWMVACLTDAWGAESNYTQSHNVTLRSAPLYRTFVE